MTALSRSRLPPASGAAPLQVLTLALGGEIFAVEARHVREILDVVPVTELPGAPAGRNGLINVRGKVVPLLDLCLLIARQPATASIDSRIVVVELTVAGTLTIAGLRADKVYEMAELAADALEDAPQIGMRLPSAFVQCVGKRAGEFIIVIDLAAVFAVVTGQDSAPALTALAPPPAITLL
jgi:purine-binding chemotaxis protein CheW